MMIWNSYRRRRRRVVVIAAMSVITGWVLVSAVVARRRSVMTVVLIRLVFIPPVRPMVTITMQLSLFPATSSKGWMRRGVFLWTDFMRGFLPLSLSTNSRIFRGATFLDLLRRLAKGVANFVLGLIVSNIGPSARFGIQPYQTNSGRRISTELFYDINNYLALFCLGSWRKVVWHVLIDEFSKTFVTLCKRRKVVGGGMSYCYRADLRLFF
jgi:hypothetical protein